MMTQTERAAAEASAAGPAAVAIGPHTFVLTPPAVEDYAALLKEMRRQVMGASSDPVSALNERVSAATRSGRPLDPMLLSALAKEAMAAATSKDQKAEPTDDQIYAQAKTRDGIVWWVWYLVRKGDASVTLADVSGWLPDDEAAFRAASDVSRVAEHKAISPK